MTGMSIKPKFIMGIKLSALEKADILMVHEFGRKLPKADTASIFEYPDIRLCSRMPSGF